MSRAATTKPWMPTAKYPAMRIAEGAGATRSIANAVTAARTAIATAAATRSTVTTTAVKTNPIASASDGKKRGEAADRALASNAAATYANPAAMANVAGPSSRYEAWMVGPPAADHSQSARPAASSG